MKIAVYGCNFGNYRNELKNGIDNIYFDETIDYYFFTDNKNLKSSIWNIIVFPLLNLEKTKDIMNSFRLTSKYVKFILPDILKSYDIIIWYDNKLLKEYPLKFNRDDIEKLFDGNNYKLINYKHPSRKTPQEELNITINANLENKNNGTLFLEKIKNNKYNTLLVDTCFIVRKNDNETNNLFENIFKLLILEGLKRDQNVYNHVIDKFKYPIDNLCYINLIKKDNYTSFIKL
jgi:hypothetical protein